MLTLRGPGEARRGLSAGELNLIPDGAILIRGEEIVEVGPTRRVENISAARDALTIEAAGRVVMPGFVDCHTHLAFPAAARDDAQAARLVRSSSAHAIEGPFRRYLHAMARHGTTTVEVKTACASDASAESKLLRVIAALNGQPLDLVPSLLWRPPHDDPPAAEWTIAELLPKIHRRRVARFADVACNGDPTLIPWCNRYLQAARALGWRCKVHAREADASAAVALAMSHGAISIDHLDHATAEHARPLGAAGSVVTLLPTPSAPGRSDPGLARLFLEAGAAVALGTDFNPHDSPALSMQAAIALASLHLGMTTEEAITAATINAAHALGLANRIGSLEPGKLADLVLLNAPDYHDLRRGLGTNLVHMTIKRGKVIYRDGEVG